MGVTRHNWPNNGFYGPGEYSDTTTWDNTADLSLSYNFDLWHRDDNAAERALELHIAKETLQQQQRIADLAQRRLKGGLGTQLELSQAEAPLPEYERQVEIHQEEIALARNQLAALAGEGPGAGEALSRPALSLATPLPLPSSLPAELVGHRPDIVAVRWTVAAQARGIDVAKAGFYPNINLAASLTKAFAGGALFSFLTRNASGYTFGPALTADLRRRRVARAARRGIGAIRSGGRSLQRHRRRGLEGHRRSGRAGAHSLDAQLDASGRSVAAARKSYTLANEGYKRGLTDYLNVLVAQAQLLRAQDDEARGAPRFARRRLRGLGAHRRPRLDLHLQGGARRAPGFVDRDAPRHAAAAHCDDDRLRRDDDPDRAVRAAAGAVPVGDGAVGRRLHGGRGAQPQLPLVWLRTRGLYGSADRHSGDAASGRRVSVGAHAGRRSIARHSVRGRFAQFVDYVCRAMSGNLERAQIEKTNLAFVADIVGFEAARSVAVFEHPESRMHAGRLARLNSEFMSASTRFHAMHQLMNRLRASASAVTIDALEPFFHEVPPLLLLRGEPVRNAADAAHAATQLREYRSTLPRRVRERRAALEADPAFAALEFDTATELLYRFVDDMLAYAETYASLSAPSHERERWVTRYVPKTNLLASSSPRPTLMSAQMAAGTLLAAIVGMIVVFGVFHIWTALC